MKNKNTTDAAAAEKQAGAQKAAEKKPTFDKELFKRSVLYNVMNMYRKNLEEATPSRFSRRQPTPSRTESSATG